MSESYNAISPATDLALKILKELGEHGHLNKSSLPMAERSLMRLEQIIRDAGAERRKTLVSFFKWWGEIGHTQHQTNPPPPFAKNDFWNCQHPMCLSLVGTIHEFSRETSPAAQPAAGETPPLS